MSRSLREPQVVVILGDHAHAADAAFLCSVLGDAFRSRQSGRQNPIIRIVTDNPPLFLDRTVPTRWKSHHLRNNKDRVTNVGSPNLVLPHSEIDNAIIGQETLDDGASADVVVVCGSSLTLHQVLHDSLLRLSKLRPVQNSNEPLLIASMGAFRRLEWRCRCLPFPDSFRPLVFSGPLCSLWYAHARKSGIIVAVEQPLSTGKMEVFVNPFSAWKSCEWLWQCLFPRIDLSLVNVSASLESLSSENLLEVGTMGLVSSLQDPTALAVASVEVGRSRHECAGRVCLDLLKEYYLVAYKLVGAAAYVNSDLGLLGKVMGSRAIVELLGNGVEDVISRIERNRSLLSHSRFLQYLVTRKVEHSFASPRGLGRLAGFPIVTRDEVASALEGLLLLLNVAEVAGMNVSMKIPTCLGAIECLQERLCARLIVRNGGHVYWQNGNKDFAFLPRTIGVGSTRDLLLLSASPIKQNRLYLRSNL